MVKNNRLKSNRIEQLLPGEGYRLSSGKASFMNFSPLLRLVFPAGISRNTVELTLTVLVALIFASIYTSSPVLTSASAIGIIAAIAVFLFAKPEYAVFFLAVILPFRDVHLVSIIHFKRFVIWSIFLYIIIRKLTTNQKFSSRSLSLFTKSAGLFIIMLVVSLFQTASEIYTTNYLTKETFKSIVFSNALVIIEEILLLYIIYYSITTLRQIQTLINIIIGVSAIIALLGILQYYLGDPPGIVSFLLDPEYRFYGRAASVFSNPNIFGKYLGPIIGIAFVSFVWGKRSKTMKFWFILPAVILDCWGVFVSSSRAAMLQVLFSLLVIGYIYYVKICHRRLSWKMILLVMIIGGIILSAIEYYEFYLRARLGSELDRSYQVKLRLIETRNDSARKYAAIRAIQTFVQHPVFGIGYGVFSGKGIARFEDLGLAVHNQYLAILVELGVLGFIPFIALFIIIVKTGMKIWDKHRPQGIPQEMQIMMLLLLTGVCTAAFGYLFADSLPVISITGYLWIFSGAIFVLERQYNELMRQMSGIKKDI